MSKLNDFYLKFKQPIDQLGHFSVGVAATASLGWLLHPLGAAFIVMGAAVYREDTQHPHTCSSGCKLDLGFWTLGAFGYVAVWYFI